MFYHRLDRALGLLLHGDGFGVEVVQVGLAAGGHENCLHALKSDGPCGLGPPGGQAWRRADLSLVCEESETLCGGNWSQVYSSATDPAYLPADRCGGNRILIETQDALGHESSKMPRVYIQPIALKGCLP